jgi:predicted AlkP superfamily phosphohydrolase/phosphomutase
MRQANRKRVFIFGIDGMPPALLFERWIDELPNIKKVMQNGIYAEMQSTVPPSTILAWTAMASGRDPGEMEIYSYNYRVSKNSDEQRLTDSTRKRKEMIWDILGKKGKKSIALYVPLTYPVKPINGVMVSDFMTPGINSECAYPAEIKEKIKELGDTEIFFDVAVGLAGHTGLGIDTLIDNTYRMTEMQLRLLKDLLKNEEWDFFMAVMIGTDRLQHTLWKRFDEEHRFFEKNSKYRDTLKDFYKYLDMEFGKILELLDENTTIIVASDHGMIRQNGKINVNDFLIKEGYLVLKEEFMQKAREKWKKEKKFTKFKLSDIDWSKTKAYEVGAYQARIYINTKAKNPERGIVDKKEYERIREEIREKLLAITDDKGNKINNRAFKPEEIYRTFDDECPDLIAYFDDLAWGVNNDGVGSDKLYLVGDEAGNDNAGHHPIGSFIISGPGIKKRGKIDRINILDITPTILKIYGIENKDLQGKAIDI